MSTETERAREVDDAVRKADAAKADAVAQAAADATRADDDGKKLDIILSHLDSVNRRLDAMERTQPAQSMGKDDMSDADKDKYGADDPDKTFMKQDARNKRAADAARADSEEIAAFKTETGSECTLTAESVKNDIHRQAERASGSWGNEPRKPYETESVASYRRRAARPHQEHSPAWKDVNLDELSGAALRNATAQIFADSVGASKLNGVDSETLREVRRIDPDSGARIREHYGMPRAWMQYFAGRPRYARFNFDGQRRGDS